MSNDEPVDDLQLRVVNCPEGHAGTAIDDNNAIVVYKEHEGWEFIVIEEPE